MCRSELAILGGDGLGEVGGPSVVSAGEHARPADSSSRWAWGSRTDYNWSGLALGLVCKSVGTPTEQVHQGWCCRLGAVFRHQRSRFNRRHPSPPLSPRARRACRRAALGTPGSGLAHLQLTSALPSQPLWLWPPVACGRDTQSISKHWLATEEIKCKCWVRNSHFDSVLLGVKIKLWKEC